MTSATPAFAAAHINEGAVFWLMAPQETRDYLLSKGASQPTITDDDRFVAAQRAAAQAALPKATP